MKIKLNAFRNNWFWDVCWWLNSFCILKENLFVALVNRIRIMNCEFLWRKICCWNLNRPITYNDMSTKMYMISHRLCSVSSGFRGNILRQQKFMKPLNKRDKTGPRHTWKGKVITKWHWQRCRRQLHSGNGCGYDCCIEKSQLLLRT